MARSPHYIDPAAEVRNADLVVRTREIARESIAILKQNPSPDTFLGRKTQEPFPEAPFPQEKSGSARASRDGT